MSFWEELSPGVKRYAVIAVVALAALLAFRSCTDAAGGGEPPPRGQVR